MNLLKFSVLFISFFSFLSLVSAQFYFDPYYFDPVNLLNNEWVVFFGIFLLVFSFCFIALNNFFSGKGKKNDIFPWITQPGSKDNKGAVIVISLVIGFFSASIFVQRGWIYTIFGDALAGWLLLLTIAVMFILSVPFIKALQANVGLGPALAITVLFVWGILQFFDPYSLFPSASYNFINIYEFVTSVGFLIGAIIIAVVFAVIKKSGR